VQPKVLDFGIAKLSEGFSANLTCEGTVLGSPAYMSSVPTRRASFEDDEPGPNVGVHRRVDFEACVHAGRRRDDLPGSTAVSCQCR